MAGRGRGGSYHRVAVGAGVTPSSQLGAQLAGGDDGTTGVAARSRPRPSGLQGGNWDRLLQEVANLHINIQVLQDHFMKKRCLNACRSSKSGPLFYGKDQRPSPMIKSLSVCSAM